MRVSHVRCAGSLPLGRFAACGVSGKPVRRGSRGFSVIEATISLTLLIIVMTVSLTLLFTMRSFAERQQYVMAPRQAARRAVDYLSYYFEGAADLNLNLNVVPRTNNPNALVMYYNSDASVKASMVKASYDNLTGAETGNAVVGGSTKFGDLGTDVITLTIPVNPQKIPIVKWPGDGNNKTIEFTYRGGCAVSDAENLRLFKLLTNESGGVGSTPLQVADRDGEWQYLHIEAYNSSNCADATGKNIVAQVSPGTSAGAGGGIDPPGGHDTPTDPMALLIGLQYVSFRVRNGNLEQKNGLFSPVTSANTGPADAPGVAFTTVMENVEDLQVAYFYEDGERWNTAGQTIDMAVSCAAQGIAGCSGNVPWQVGPRSILRPALDITNVVALRFNVTARSTPLTLGSRRLTNTGASGNHFRPATENHPASAIDVFPNIFDHTRITTMLLLRNRVLGS